MAKETLLEIDSAEQALFKKKLKELGGYKGRGTELISVYIPFGTDRSSVMNQLATEMGQSGNIKSPQTRKNVQSALKKISNYLKQIDFDLPPTGLVVFAGNVSPIEGRNDLRLFSVKPLKPLRTKLYWCDSSFHLVPLEEMMVPTEVYVFIVMDKREATVALLVGKRYDIIGHFTSNVAGKFRAGGQCLDPKTIVTLANGQNIPISKVEVGMEVTGLDLHTKKIKQSKIKDKWETYKKQLQIKTKNTTIISSPEHVFFIQNEKSIEERQAGDLHIADTLIQTNGGKIESEKIESVQMSNEEIPMIDISVENPNFFANGLLVHNSAQRFEHLREEAANDFYKSVSNKINATLEGKWDKLKGIIVGGPGQTKKEFLDVGELDYRLKDKILGIIDLSYTDESGIREIIQRSDDILRNTDLMRERAVIEKFMQAVVKDGLATYGQMEVEAALERGQVSLLILSEGILWRVIKVKCTHCGVEKVFTIKDPKQEFDDTKIKCEKCQSPVEEVEETDYLDHLLETAHAMGTETHVISMDSDEGVQFYNSFGGIGAMLRYK